MAWSWSHTQEAYDNAEANLRELRNWELREIYAEWKAHSETEDFNDYKYRTNLVKAQALADDVLADFVWDKACEQQTCDNGGFNAWVCPYGCHTVSFSREDEDDSSEN